MKFIKKRDLCFSSKKSCILTLKDYILILADSPRKESLIDSNISCKEKLLKVLIFTDIRTKKTQFSKYKIMRYL
jgi:hypothetical protein